MIQDSYNFRKSNLVDLDDIMEIIDQAKASLKQLGIWQWQDGYPNHDTILDDIENGNSFVLEDNHQIIATIALVSGEEPTYQKIYGGKWHIEGPYVSIHRIAVRQNLRQVGIGLALLKFSEAYLKVLNYQVLRVDTHYQNQAALNLFEKHGFIRCGVIFLREEFDIDVARIALEKAIK